MEGGAWGVHLLYLPGGGCGSWIHMALIILRRMEFSLYQSTGGRWGRLFCLVQRKIPSAMLNPRGLLGDVLGHALPSHPVPFFMFGKLKKILYIQDVPFPYRRVWNRLPVFRAIFPLGYWTFLVFFRFDAYKFMLPFVIGNFAVSKNGKVN